MAQKKKPNDPPPGDDDDDDVEPFSPRQLEILNNTVTAAVSAHVGRKIKPLSDQLTTMSESFLEKIEALGKGATGQQPAPGQQDPKNGQQQGAPQPDPEKVAMKQRLDALETERKTERLTARNASRDAALTEIATKSGVDKNRIRGAVAILREQVKYDETANKHVMPVKRNGFDEDVELEAGAAEFFKTEEGKSYLAPAQGNRGGSGSGRGTSATGVVRGQAGGAGGNNPAQGAGSKADKKVEAANALMGAVTDLLGGGNINVG